VFVKKQKQNTSTRALEIKRETVVHLGERLADLEDDQLKRVVGGSNSLHPSQCGMCTSFI
jgi:hypothetical protein